MGLKGDVTFHEFKIGSTFKHKMAHLEDKIMNHAS